MRKFILLFLICFAFVSCGWQKPQSPKHFIYGKWISESSSKFELIFSDDKKCYLKSTREDGKIFESSEYRFVIIDEKSVKIIVDGWEEYKLSVTAKIVNGDKLRIECINLTDSQGRTPVDLPTICNSDYNKVESNL